MIQLTRNNGDSIFLHPDHIIMVEPILSGKQTRITINRGYVDVLESVAEVGALLRGSDFPGFETKAVATPISEEEAAGMPPAEIETQDNAHGLDAESLTKAELRAEALKRGLDVTGADTKEKLLTLLQG